MTEIWKDIDGYLGTYQVSSFGRVRSLDRIDARGRKRIGQILSLWIDPKGRPNANLRSKRHTVCRLVLNAFVGPAPLNKEACHNDGNPANNKLENLRWDTRSENTKDAIKHGTNFSSVKTHCKFGHILRPPNLVLYLLNKGQRRCRICHNAQCRASKNRRRSK